MPARLVHKIITAWAPPSITTSTAFEILFSETSEKLKLSVKLKCISETQCRFSLSKFLIICSWIEWTYGVTRPIFLTFSSLRAAKIESEDVTTLVNQEKINSIKGGSNTDKPDEEKIRSILENELYNNVSDESDTSISYTHGNFNDESFEDVFSNVNGENANSKNDIASIASEIFLNNLIKEDTPKRRKSKQEYFSKYMKV